MIPEHEFNKECEYLKAGSCYQCCDKCNYDRHTCHFCGAILDHNSYEYSSGEKQRHWLSDCRPDLVEHEIGETCTWYDVGNVLPNGKYDCYAYQNRDTQEWEKEHKHFYKDGPMA